MKSWLLYVYIFSLVLLYQCFSGEYDKILCPKATQQEGVCLTYGFRVLDSIVWKKEWQQEMEVESWMNTSHLHTESTAKLKVL